MTKQFLYFLWAVGLFIFLYLAFVNLFMPLNFLLGGTWIDFLGFPLSLIVFVPLYKLFKLLPKIKRDLPAQKVLVTVLLLSLWFLIPLSYQVFVLHNPGIHFK